MITELQSPWDGTALPPVGNQLNLDAAALRLRSQQLAAQIRNHGPAPLTLLTAWAQSLAQPDPQAVELVVREAGKTRSEATAEMALLAKKITITLGALGETQSRPADINAGPVISHRPRGLAAVLGPFNFPLHLLHGFVVPALATGNPVLAKVSERTPGVAQWYASSMAAAGLAPWCMVLCGGAAMAQALLADPALATVALVGSQRTARAITTQLAARPEVVFAAEMGGVNHVLICADAELEVALLAIAEGAWRQAGQRCTATRIVHVPSALISTVVAQLDQQRRAWMADGTPDGPLGPLITVAARDHAVAWLAELSTRHQVIGGAAWGHAGIHPAMVVWDPTAPLPDDEWFAPIVCLRPYDDETDAVALMQANALRLACAVWTAEREHFCVLAAQLPYGQCYHNRSTAGARSDLPFGGCGTSGNSRPGARSAAAIFTDQTVIW